ncbi:TPA: hypothetical protein ACVO3E_004282 [Vibrio diabolicus]
MRLSHRKKVASKHGNYWPSRTKQARERREARERLAVNMVQASATVSAFAVAAQQFAQAIASATQSVIEGAKEIKTWLINRDSSQRKANSPRDSHTGKILIKAPQNDSF